MSSDAAVFGSRDAPLNLVRYIVIDLTRLLAESNLGHVEWLDQIDSTNDYALKLTNNPNIQLPYLIGVERQTAGRGRGGNSWWGAEGALMFSLGVDMATIGLKTSDWPRLSLITGLAIAETISYFLPTNRVGLKWPNDVWLEERKVCGILIEQADGNANRFVVGIGMNVNNSFENAPEEQRKIAISMTDAVRGNHFSRTDVLIRFLDRWTALIRQLVDGNVDLVNRWSHACVLSGHPVMVTSGNHETTGICHGIDDDGSLLLRTTFSLDRCYAGTARRLD